MKPATNIFTTDSSAMAAYRIIGIDGGMMMARLADEDEIAAANSLE